jgi:hypothetical protein
MPRDYFCSVSHFDFGVRRAADHPVTVAVERQARGGFRFHTFRASVVVDGAVRTTVWHSLYAFHTILIVMQKADHLIFPAPFIGVLASLFLDETAEIFYSEDEALMDAILVIIRGELPV